MRYAPKISVLMGIYNCQGTLREAVRSIQSQTCTDWELILCDDGSTDGTLMMAKVMAQEDGRIRVIENSRNCGLARTLDRCAAVAQGKYFARMDGDDLCSPERFTRLASALDSHPDVAVVSSWMSSFDEHGTWGMVRTEEHPEPRDFLRGSPICHAPCMMRRSAFEAVGGYGSEPWLIRAEDYYLWFKFYAAGYRALNIQEALYAMRDDRQARSRRTLRSRINECIVRWKGFGMLGFPLWLRLWAIRPLLVWMLPRLAYDRLRRRLRA